MQDSLWQRLKQRKIVQWAVGYLAVAYALLEGLDIVGDNFNWPAFVPRVAAVLLAFGFVATLVLAWFHGERGHQRMPASELVILVLLAIVGVPVAWWVGVNTPANSGASGAAEETSTGAQFAAFDPATAARSVAVLPFNNLTGDPQNDYLADGITEDIIAALGNNAAMRVISRTSVMRYKNTDKTIPEIGAELGVGMILEGSVRIQGDSVRIVAQLIDVASDAHVWSETFNGSLSEIFALQTRVAESVAERLDARMPGVLADAGEAMPTVDTVAYRYFMRGRDLANSSSESDRRMARVYFDSAVAQDPEFARAYEAIAELETPMQFDIMPPPTPAAEQIGAPTTTGATGPVSAEDAAERALSLNPRLVGAQSALAIQNAMRGRDMASAAARAQKAVTDNPQDVRARQRYASILAGIGRTDEAKSQLRQAMANDPLSSPVASQMGEIEFALGNLDEAERYLRSAIELDSGGIPPRVTYALVLKERGDTAGALREIERAAALDPNNTLVLSTHGYLLGLSGQHEEAMAIAARLEQRARAGRLPGAVVAQIYSAAGEVGHAVEWLRLGAEHARVHLFLSPKMQHAIDEMREIPALRATLDSLDFRVLVPDSLRRRR